MAQNPQAPLKNEPFDFTAWPVVVACMPAFDEFRMDIWTAGLDRALAAKEPFVFVIQLDAFLKDPRESQEEKKKGSLWMKRNRAELSRYCRGNVYVVPDEKTAAAILAETRKQGEALGIALEAATSIESAIVKAHRLIKQAP